MVRISCLIKSADPWHRACTVYRCGYGSRKAASILALLRSGRSQSLVHRSAGPAELGAREKKRGRYMQLSPSEIFTGASLTLNEASYPSEGDALPALG